MRKYVTGLVVGKFCPLTQGHVHLLQTASDLCENLVIISYTSLEFPGCEPHIRRTQLTTLFPSARVHVLDHVILRDDAPEDTHRAFCADILLNHLGTTVQAVFTSEAYGNGFAESLSQYFTRELGTQVNVDHVCVDITRTAYPISGTVCREQLANGMLPKLLHPIVYSQFVPRIAILGGESSGKTTVAKLLSRHPTRPYVAEYGRELYDIRGGKLMFEDMEQIATTQINHETTLASPDSAMLICDTTPLTTLFYSYQLFGHATLNLSRLAKRKYHKTYLCSPDMDFVQDGTRRDAEFRMTGHNWYINNLQANNIQYTLVSGSPEERAAFILNDLGISV